MDADPLPALSVEELEELLSRRRMGRAETQHALRRALAGAVQLRKLRAAYDREMRERVAAAAAGRRSYVDPAQVIAFLSPEQREQLLDRMSQDRLAAQERLQLQQQQQLQQLEDIAAVLALVLEDPDEEQQLKNLQAYRQDLQRLLGREGDADGS